MSLYVGDRTVCLSIQNCTLDGHLHRVTYTRWCTIDSLNDHEHRGARNMYRIGI